jgi:hypothetical protein
VHYYMMSKFRSGNEGLPIKDIYTVFPHCEFHHSLEIHIFGEGFSTKVTFI